MPRQDGKPLTSFLIALGHSPELLTRFREDPEGVLKEWGLQHHAGILHPGVTLQELQDAVTAEHDGDASAAIVGPWIQVSASGPTTWIRSPSSEDDGEGSGGGGGGPARAQ